MSRIEKSKINDVTYYYFVKELLFMGSKQVIRKYLGKKPQSKTKFIIDNLSSLTKEELDFKKKFFDEIADKTYKENLLENIEKKNALINNLIEAKHLQEAIDIAFSKEFIYNSNNIEGSKMPPEVVEEIIEKNITKYKNKNEVVEVNNSIKAYEFVKNKFYFNIESIKRLYYILTKNLKTESGDFYFKGFKEKQIIVGNEKTTDPENVEKELKNLLSRYKSNKKLVHPLIQAFKFHLDYESIHPFEDANGRTGRLILNKILISNNYFPMLVRKSRKKAYFTAIKKARDGNLKKYYDFMLKELDYTYDFILKKIKIY